MTHVAIELTPALKTLVDSRLEAIERTLLLGGAPRQERLAVIEDVESQVQEMLVQRLQGQAANRRDVLGVLAALDPPEAYIGEEGKVLLPRLGTARLYAASAPRSVRPRPAIPQPSIVALGSATAGLILLVLGFWLSALGLKGEVGMVALMLAIFWFIAAVGINAAGVMAIIRIRQSNGRLYGLPLALFAVLLLPMILINVSLLVTVMLFEQVGLYAVASAFWVFLNIVLVWQAWKWVSTGYTIHVLEKVQTDLHDD